MDNDRKSNTSIQARNQIQLKHVGEQIWEFEFPRITWEILEKFHEAIELWEMNEIEIAEKEYRRLIAGYPEFIDAHHHLALLLDETGREEEAFTIWKETVQLGLDCLQVDFHLGTDQLPWDMLDNRPFLRTLQGLGITLLERDLIKPALRIFYDILSMNPNDNQGVRAIIVDCQFHYQQPNAVLDICQQYPNDGMEQLVYGQALALFQIGRKAKAKRALLKAINFLPLVGRELVKTRHRRPKNLFADCITHGGADQAYYYWIHSGKYWKETPGAIDLVRECLDECGQTLQSQNR